MSPANSPPLTVAIAPMTERQTGRWKLRAMAQMWPPPMESPRQPKMSSVFMSGNRIGPVRDVSKGFHDRHAPGSGPGPMPAVRRQCDRSARTVETFEMYQRPSHFRKRSSNSWAA